ncbi:MAG: formate dehydrogenase accessory sulfurtransferase FdhD [Gammaproteobacteria bacterium]|nr:formate dehydrogenase accessory sulfurtransferase FdhD [Gammaproteobacteria bacterium]MYD81475.1 formate dehydrogenase accessory sulfurtransferase FdhD [Gammaproteobacteria bacterium]
MNDQHRAVPIQKFGSRLESTDDFVTIEEPLEIRIRYFDKRQIRENSLSVTMRTPGDDLDLACGFLLSEGIVKDYSQIQEAVLGADWGDAPSAENVVSIQLHEGAQFDPDSLLRHFYTTSSCGVCGKVSLATVKVHVPSHLPSDFKISADQITLLPNNLRNRQMEFSKTGGLHASALFDSDAKILRVREDVGRHNALDKLLGSFRESGLESLRTSGLLLSGRASFELLQKAAIAGIPLVASIGPPSSLAIDLARDQDITLIGFLRDETFNLYHGERVVRD